MLDAQHSMPNVVSRSKNEVQVENISVEGKNVNNRMSFIQDTMFVNCKHTHV